MNLRVKTFRVPRLGIDDLSVDVHRVFILERRVSSKHFIHKYSYRPPINWLSMALIEQDFRSNILGSTTNGVCSLTNDLCKPKVNELQEAVVTNHDVLRFQVSVHNVFVMQVFED